MTNNDAIWVLTHIKAHGLAAEARDMAVLALQQAITGGDTEPKLLTVVGYTTHDAINHLSYKISFAEECGDGYADCVNVNALKIAVRAMQKEYERREQ